MEKQKSNNSSKVSNLEFILSIKYMLIKLTLLFSGIGFFFMKNTFKLFYLN